MFNSHVTDYISELKILQVSVKSIIHLKNVIALYTSFIYPSTAIQLEVAISADSGPNSPL